MKRHLIILYLLLGGLLAGFAQIPRNYSADDYLTNSLTTCMIQDSRGFLWAGTRYGLSRYDGHRFRHFTHQDGDTLSLGNNDVMCMAERSDGTVLVGTTSGMDAYDYRSQVFRKVPMLDAEGREIALCGVAQILPLRSGEVLVASQGWGIFRMRVGESVARHDKAIDFKGFADVLQMTEDRQGRIWLLTGRLGVCRLTLNSKGSGGTMRKYLETESPQAGLTKLVALPDGGIMVGSDYGGLFRYDAATDRFSAVPDSRHLAVSALYVDSGRQLLIGTNGHGVHIYDTTNGTLRTANYYHKDLDLPTVKVSDIVEDRNGNLWLAVYQKGLFMQPGHANGFRVIGRRSEHPEAIGSHCVMSLLPTRDGTLWIGCDNDGLYQRDRSGSIRHYATGFTVMGMTEGDDGTLWLATYNNGCGRFDPTTGLYRQLECTTQGNTVHCMDVTTDRQGNLWIATNGEGIIRYRLSDGNTTRYYYNPHDPGRPNMLVNNWVNVVRLSADGRRLYIGMSNGMMTFDLCGGLFTDWLGGREVLHGSAVRAVREMADGRLWVATSNGLCCINPKDKSQQRLTMRDELPADDVTSVEYAPDGSLWVGTLYGLSHCQPKTGRVVNYFADNGLQGNEYSNGASCRGADGTLFFGGNNGITMFHPSQVGNRQDSLRVYVTGLTLNGKEVTEATRSGWRRVMDGTVMDCRDFSFAYEDNTFTLDLSTMNFALSNSLRYAWRINEGSWTVLPQGISELTMNHLAPGDYGIEVKAITGDVESKALRLRVTVRPPLYRTWWAYLCYVLCVAFAIGWFFTNRRRREQDRLRLQEHIHAAEMKEQHLQQLVSDQAHQQVLDQQEETVVLSPDEQLLERVIRIVTKHLDNSDFSVEFLAGEVGLSRSQLHRRLKAITNQSCSDFIRSVRLKHAAQLLESGRQNISEVAYSCGFETPSSFSTAFKKFYGVPPSEFTRRNNTETA